MQLPSEELNDHLEAVRGRDFEEVLLHDGRIAYSLEPYHYCSSSVIRPQRKLRDGKTPLDASCLKASKARRASGAMSLARLDDPALGEAAFSAMVDATAAGTSLPLSELSFLCLLRKASPSRLIALVELNIPVVPTNTPLALLTYRVCEWLRVSSSLRSVHVQSGGA
jgi:hypothetical protein